MMGNRIHLVVACLLAVLGCGHTKETCPVPPPAANFTLAALSGRWFEIGKVQTIGGALIEGDCVCTLLDYEPVDDSDAVVSNICHDTSPDGEIKVANATIEPAAGGAPGAFEESFCTTCPAVSYTIVSLDAQSMVEFDCTVGATGLLSYCFHAMSRTPTMDPATLVGLQALMGEYGLNPHNLEWKTTNQTGCGWR
jgi:apolipoprotein D and lipocalin family protein